MLKEGRRQEGKRGERRSGGAEELGKLRELRKLRKKRELIIFGYKAQEIPPKISFTRKRVLLVS